MSTNLKFVGLSQGRFCNVFCHY